jgi:hypothetical protein
VKFGAAIVNIIMNKVLNTLLIVSLMSLSSCFFSIHYYAKYTLHNDRPADQMDEKAQEIISGIAGKYKLCEDESPRKKDTLGFYGVPYHYFKFNINSDSLASEVELDYRGAFGSRRKPPYQELLKEFLDSMKSEFKIVGSEIKETSNQRPNWKK